MEQFLQQIWQQRMWKHDRLVTVGGEPVEVLDPGLLNHDAGPDFFNAKIKIGGKIWVGNVEVHVRASDWHRHRHDSDPAYGTVILHVVLHDDARITRPDGSEIPQLVLACAGDFKKLCDRMTDRPDSELACFRNIASVPDLYRTDWLTALAFERMHAKAEHLMGIMPRTGGNWRGALYVLLARALGFGVNSEPFERLALATPLSVLLHHQNDCHSVESILMGQAGLLDEDAAGGAEKEYIDALRRDYDFLSRKYSLVRPSALGWKLARMRPQNFPHRRIAWLAAAVAGGFSIATDLAAVADADSARRLFDVTLSPFWSSHYTFAPAEGCAPGSRLSRSAVDILIINVIVPALLAYSRTYGNGDAVSGCTAILQSLPPENNRVVRLFVSAGIGCPDAFTSQALVQLRRCYCEPRKCIYCRFGQRFLHDARRQAQQSSALALRERMNEA